MLLRLHHSGENIGLKFIPNESELFRVIPEFVFELLRVIPNQSKKRFVARLMKNGQISIRGINPNEYEPNFQFELIRGRIDPN